jgi:hypothetical protein
MSKLNISLVNMKTNTITLALINAILAAPALATINFGKAVYNTDGHVDNAIWIDGQDACAYVYMGPDGQNPCQFNGGYFTAQNGIGYQIVGCGGNDFKLLNAGGSYNSNAHYNPYPNACVASGNKFHVDQQFSFY